VSHVLGQAGAALAVTGARAAALRVPCESDEVLLLTVPAGLGAEQLQELGAHWEVDGWRRALGESVPHVSCADELSMAAVKLAKSAQLLPALLVSGPHAGAVPPSVLAVSLEQLARHALPQADDLVRVSEARVPLRDEEASRVV